MKFAWFSFSENRKKQMDVFEGLLSEGNEECCKAKIQSRRTGYSENFFVAVLQHDVVS
jgi:hypothetical protein